MTVSSTATPLTEIEAAVAQLRVTFGTNKTKAISWRKQQLRQLYAFIRDQYPLIEAALKKDLNRNPADTQLELVILLNEVADAIEHLEEWMKPTASAPTLLTFLDTAVTRREPLGVVCIIAPFNFPVQLLLGPLIAAIAAGNCVVLKPSEMATASEALLIEWLPKILDMDAFRIIVGGVKETTRLLEVKLDHIFYTGSTSVGKIVMAAAAKQLTPVVLELGGKSPVYIHKDVDIEVAARRMCWAKTMNCGQVCIAPDYVMVHQDIVAPFAAALRKVLLEFYTEDAKKSTEYPRMINQAHTKRLVNVLDRQLALKHSELVIGGDHDVSDRYIAPTVVSNVKVSDPLMEDEIFGPLIGILSVTGEDEAIEIIQSRDRPLALYVSAKDTRVVNKILDNTISGVSVVNDYVFNMVLGDMPFGGVGSSGMGAYHGHSGFLAFTHQRGMVWRGTDFLTETVHKFMYPPFASSPFALFVSRVAVVKPLPSEFGLLLRKVVKRVAPILGQFALLAVAFYVGRSFQAGAGVASKSTPVLGSAFAGKVFQIVSNATESVLRSGSFVGLMDLVRGKK
ncbi:hypothetical protein CcCBS67573_g01797 [Chytriomyces confervae]|uniref:Aldehyde dehydrogenase domain-containing protein n=1 Tax=Chytriomyces confervae TaxID=246404 RepID=A0A507FNN1_9FUNG|nr:Aldehyde dehydrogenase [Chytriomyces hyalinus]TPX76936.1 hypothetical protein CcCBS67573_g01797 [Chytriomyces confervae]